ncbi:GTP 3',8-cyclase MoaA [Undibacterium sp. CY7W]|uniref:GTP 3',8-cyclase n=1 Tax=Undibacterium rugosum TaxID=2762291 RepID=A0A923I3C7_9BURK|nr:GTP 3',8-cyclase MoaA [Undibacterium rugosum]MBC3935605.1 GTP 3',8-cyclase MoaA [Undibacterium rugosum]
MTEKFIPITDIRQQAVPLPSVGLMQAATGQLLDSLQRPLRDLRISVTDRCNFRCVYCMPKEIFDQNYHYLPHADLLNFEEITRLARIFVAHGVKKIRLTGGEPLLRKNIEQLIAMLANLRTVDGAPLDLSLTTNGSLLAKKALSLKNAGLGRVTVSLDAINDDVFRRMNDVDYRVDQVLAGIAAAEAAGLGPVKVNMVVKAGINDSQIVPMAEYFKHSPHILRFIEYMDVGASNGWRMGEVVTADQILQRLQQAGMQLATLDANYPGETARRWKHRHHAGEIGIISSVTQAFCGDCSRIRLSTEGQLYTCLFATRGYDLRPLLRSARVSSDQELADGIASVWQQRSDRYSELRSSDTFVPTSASKKIEMSYIGG